MHMHARGTPRHNSIGATRTLCLASPTFFLTYACRSRRARGEGGGVGAGRRRGQRGQRARRGPDLGRGAGRARRGGGEEPLRLPRVPEAAERAGRRRRRRRRGRRRPLRLQRMGVPRRQAPVPPLLHQRRVCQGRNAERPAQVPGGRARRAPGRRRDDGATVPAVGPRVRLRAVQRPGEPRPAPGPGAPRAGRIPGVPVPSAYQDRPTSRQNRSSVGEQSAAGRRDLRPLRRARRLRQHPRADASAAGRALQVPRRCLPPLRPRRPRPAPGGQGGHQQRRAVPRRASGHFSEPDTLAEGRRVRAADDRRGEPGVHQARHQVPAGERA
uniref:Uncharacterized protein n=1 Tax=Zea mays TaxID=4577 RepID=C4J9H5_MAIZE|nr:unknown [Zea mays]